MEATPENREKLEKYILEYYARSAFNTCTCTKIPKMSGEPMQVHWREGPLPKPDYTPAKIPHHWKSAVKEGLDNDGTLGIIERVPEGVPTRFCSRMIVQVKKNGKLRRCVDLQKINDHTFREVNYNRVPHQLVCDLPSGQKKTVLDAWNGYHAVELMDEAKEATTFITEWGPYRYCSSPQGYHASGDHYTRRMDEITMEVGNKRRCIDDTLLYQPDLEKSFWATVKYIDLCNKNGVIFNPKKFKFPEDIVEFAGFELTPSGYRPTKERMKAIADFPIPKNLTDIRAFFGLIEQVAFAFAKSEVMAPFRELLRKNRDFYWDKTLATLFEEAKVEIVHKIKDGVANFELGRKTMMTTDYSETGVGYFLRQQHCNCDMTIAPHCGQDHWKVVCIGSRVLRDSKKGLAPIEGEALGMYYGLNSARTLTDRWIRMRS